jgi:hypothetical protein
VPIKTLNLEFYRPRELLKGVKMRKHVYAILVLSLLLSAGCVDKESNKTGDSKNLSSDVSQVQLELTALKTQMETDKARYESEIALLKQENIEIQNTAMKAIMTMLEKQTQHDQKIQNGLKDKISKLEEINSQLKDQVSLLENNASSSAQATAVSLNTNN